MEKFKTRLNKIRLCILILIAICIYMPIVNANEYINETMANPENIEEFVKADGTTYNISRNQQIIEERTTLKNVDTLYGRYQFNHTGAGVIESEIILGYASGKGTAGAVYPDKIDEQYYSKLSTLSGYEWLADYENPDSYYTDTKLIDKDTGKLTIKGNSAAAELEQYNKNDKIYKAYLVVSCVAKPDSTGKIRYLLEDYPITLIGPNAKYIKTRVETICRDSTSTERQ